MDMTTLLKKMVLWCLSLVLVKTHNAEKPYKSYFVVDCDDRNMLNANFNVFFLWNIKNEKDNLYLGKFSYQKKGVTVRG